MASASSRPAAPDPGKALAALGNPFRWEVVQLLADGTPRHGVAIARHFQRDFDGVSKHLRQLRAAGILISRRGEDRRREEYSLPPEALAYPGWIHLGFCILRHPAARSASPPPLAAEIPAPAAEPAAPRPRRAAAGDPSPPSPGRTALLRPDAGRGRAAEAADDEEDGEEDDSRPVIGFGEMMVRSLSRE